jgi:sugar/nucleoside kinase (ribokinase family)
MVAPYTRPKLRKGALMNNSPLDIIGIGNAIVDVLVREEDSFLDAHGLTKSEMALIDMEQAGRLYQAMGPGVEQSGGSVANSIAGIAALGAKAGYVGKVADDQLGEVFSHDIHSLGVEFDTPASTSGISTARCFIIVTPDANRTMNTFLGACQELGEDDIAEDQIARAKIVYLEGYLWDPPAAKKAFLKAMGAAHEAGNRVALTLSDSFCVGRYRDEFLELVEKQVDILFANEDEITSLYQTDDFEAALGRVSKANCLAILTRGEKGASIVSGDGRVDVPAFPCDVVDTTGAGDLYAAGFLYGLSQNMDHETCGRIAAISAAEIISHVGARPDCDLREFVEARLGRKLI